MQTIILDHAPITMMIIHDHMCGVKFNSRILEVEIVESNLRGGNLLYYKGKCAHVCLSDVEIVESNPRFKALGV